MAVVVQELVAGEASGITFSLNPADASEGVIGAVYGLNQGLVDGAVEPDRWIFHRKEETVKEHNSRKGKNGPGPKVCLIWHGPVTGFVMMTTSCSAGSRSSFSGPCRRAEDACWKTTLMVLPTWARAWLCAAWLTRAINPAPPKTRKDIIRAGRPVYESTAGPGIGRGRARVIDSVKDLAFFKKGEVLVCDAVDPNMTFVVPLAAGVVERRDGMLIHGAIITREYGIACVTGVVGAATLIHTGDEVTVDGYLGIVTVGQKDSAVAS